MGSLRAIQRQRDRRTDRVGSPYFSVSFGQINASGGAEKFDTENESQLPGASKYAPLNFVEITNNSLADLTLEVNDNVTQHIPIPAGVVKVYERRAIWRITLINDSAVQANSGEVIAVFQKASVDADELARRNYG